MLPKDYVRLRLTGEWAIDAADASGTLLFDVARRRWSDEVLDALELPRDWLPPVLESPDRRRRVRLRRHVARDARRGRRRRPARGGARRRRRPARAGVGRARHVGRRARRAPGVRARPRGPRPRLLPRRARHLAGDGRDAVRRRARSNGSTSGSRRTPRSTRSSRRPRPWPPGAEGLLFAPYLAGERTPHADPDARGAFVGLQLRHDRGALVRAVLEGVAFGLRDALDAVRELGVDASVGRASGGGARSPLWLEIVASVLDMPLELHRVRGRLGVRRCAARRRRGGRLRRRVRGRRTLRPRRRRPVEPDPALARGVRASVHARFRALYPALRPFGSRHAERPTGADSATAAESGDRALDNTVIRYFNRPTSTVRCAGLVRRPETRR